MSIYQTQKADKPKIEDVAGDFLNAEKTAAMLDLVKFIRANKIGVQWASGNSWALNCKGKRLGYLKIDNDTWRFCHNRAYLENYYNMEDCALKTFVFEHIYARTCGDCQSNPNAQIAEYMNPTDCGCWPFRVHDPVFEALEYTKQVIELRKNLINGVR